MLCFWLPEPVPGLLLGFWLAHSRGAAEMRGRVWMRGLRLMLVNGEVISLPTPSGSPVLRLVAVNSHAVEWFCLRAFRWPGRERFASPGLALGQVVR
jgi:hypothetical protein